MYTSEKEKNLEIKNLAIYELCVSVSVINMCVRVYVCARIQLSVDRGNERYQVGCLHLHIANSRSKWKKEKMEGKCLSFFIELKQHYLMGVLVKPNGVINKL